MNTDAALLFPAGLCLGCDYPVVGLEASRCPECGRTFDPHDRATINVGPPLGPAGRFVLSPAGWPVMALSLAPAAWIAWVATDPQLYYMGGSGFLSAFACILLLILHFAWRAARRLVLRRCGHPVSVRPVDDRTRWRNVWIVTAVTVKLVLWEVPPRLAFLAHRPAFERLVAEVRSNAPSCTTLPGRHVGIYTLGTWSPAEANGAAIMFRFEGNEGGFAYSPRGPSELRYNSGDAGRLWGDWYWFSED